MTENRTVQQKSVRRNRLAAAACFAAALITVGVVGAQSATADPAAHSSAHDSVHRTAVAAPGFGSAALVQSQDFPKGLNPVGATVELTGREGLSACSGEETMSDLTKGQATGYASVTWTLDSKANLHEMAANAPTEAAAATWEQQLVALVQDCQDEPTGHWHYGEAHTLTAAGGTARWYLAHNGDGTVSGGVAVLRSGTRVALVELNRQPTDASPYVEGIATAALNRLSS